MSRRGIDTAWTEAELAIVREFYPILPPSEVAAKLPGRSRGAVYGMAKKLKIHAPRRWSPADDELLRASWGKLSSRELARTLERSPSAIKQHAIRLGLDAGRYFNDEEIALVRELYPTTTAAEIAKRIYGTGQGAIGIYKVAQKLGLRKCPHWSQEEMERVKLALADGGTDNQVAARLKLTREQVTHIRNRLGIPRNASAVLESRRRAVDSQRRSLGIQTGGELRAMGYRRYARECGWPEDLPPRAVQILNVLAEHGPKTRLELAEAIGMPTTKVGCNGGLKLLTASSHSSLMKGHASYPGLLKARGLIIEQRRSVGPGNGKGLRGNGRLPGVYMLTPAAITIREKNLERQRERVSRIERAGETDLHTDAPRPGTSRDTGPRRPRDVGPAAQGSGEAGDHRRGRQ
jgi:hypothetical protein